jgi:dTDP-L-rhamnose 4-epimerase
MQIVVTGAAGFIGSYVWRELIRRGHLLRGFDSFEPQAHRNMPQVQMPNIIAKDVGSLTPDDLRGAEVLVHLASLVGVAQSQYEPQRYVQQNVRDYMTLLDVARQAKVKHFVVASSMSIYGEGEYLDAQTRQHVMHSAKRSMDPVVTGWDSFYVLGAELPVELTPTLTTELKTPEPASVYAQTKYDVERYGLIYGESIDVPCAALRFFNTYGPGQNPSNPYTGALAIFASRHANSQPALIYEDGNQKRDFVYVEDVARAVAHAAEDMQMHGVRNVCTGVGTTITELEAKMAEAMRFHEFNPVAPKHTKLLRSGDIRHCVGDPRMFAKDGWRYSVELDEGIAKTAAWMWQAKDAIKIEDRTDQALEELTLRGLVT